MLGCDALLLSLIPDKQRVRDDRTREQRHENGEDVEHQSALARALREPDHLPLLGGACGIDRRVHGLGHPRLTAADRRQVARILHVARRLAFSIASRNRFK
jgi:hypothetical protein